VATVRTFLWNFTFDNTLVTAIATNHEAGKTTGDKACLVSTKTVRKNIPTINNGTAPFLIRKGLGRCFCCWCRFANSTTGKLAARC